MTKPHYDLVIATPGHSMVADYVHSLVNTLRWLDSMSLSYVFLNKQSSLVSDARERTATNTDSSNWSTNEIGSGEFTYDRILWIDSDIAWEARDVERLWLADRDIISGLYQTDAVGRVAAHQEDANGLPTYVDKIEFALSDDPVEVKGVGFGFVMMKQGVFETVERPWFLIRRIKWPDVDYYTMVGEDYSFCAAARAAGYSIWVHPDVKVCHYKTTIWKP
jgi:hypothetical protein